MTFDREDPISPADKRAREALREILRANIGSIAKPETLQAIRAQLQADVRWDNSYSLRLEIDRSQPDVLICELRNANGDQLL